MTANGAPVRIFEPEARSSVHMTNNEEIYVFRASANGRSLRPTSQRFFTFNICSLYNPGVTSEGLLCGQHVYFHRDPTAFYFLTLRFPSPCLERYWRRYNRVWRSMDCTFTCQGVTRHLWNVWISYWLMIFWILAQLQGPLLLVSGAPYPWQQ